MKNIFLAVSVLLAPAGAFGECPREAGPGDLAVETAADCPWAGAARALAETAGRGGDLEPVFGAHAPGLLAQLDADKGEPALLKLWGESINFDELAKGEIVPPAVLGFISARLGAAAPRGRIMHAGLEHTYGYLFSLLPTKFGFKRARWVLPAIEEGLGLPAGSAGPAPERGTLLSNVTCLAGGIALRGDKAAAPLLAGACAHSPAALRKFRAAAGRPRLSETVSLPGGRTVSLRTDFVPFLKPSGGNTHLLIYSVRDSALEHAYLVTAFPVGEGFVKNATDPAGLGENEPVQTRYNAYVEGVTGAAGLKGRRAVSFAGRGK